MDLIDYNEVVRLLIAGEEVQEMTLAEAVWTVMFLEVGRVRVSARILRDGAPVLRFVDSRTGAVAWAMRQRSVSRPRSSNRTCGFPASGFPTGFTAQHTAARRVRCVLPKQWAMADAPSSTDRRPSSPRGKASSEAS